jgi:hypothetical protein
LSSRYRGRNSFFVAYPSFGKGGGHGEVVFPGEPHHAACQIGMQIVAALMGVDVRRLEAGLLPALNCSG